MIIARTCYASTMDSMEVIRLFETILVDFGVFERVNLQ